MRCLTLTQPWASLVAIGAKHIETRSWSTFHRGPLAIHAAKGFPSWARTVCWREPFRSALLRGGYRLLSDLPRGGVVAICTLADVVPVERLRSLNEREASFGDYSAGRYAWLLTDVHMLPEAVLAKGSLGLWGWPA